MVSIRAHNSEGSVIHLQYTPTLKQQRNIGVLAFCLSTVAVPIVTTSVMPEPLLAELKFLANLDGPLVYIPSKGGGDSTEHVGNFAMQAVEIRDARQNMMSSQLDVEGFKLVSQVSAVDDFFDDAQVASVYHEEVRSLLSRETGAKRVEIFDDTRRSASVERQQATGIREPADIVHNDYTARSGVKRLRDHFADKPEEAEKLLQRRFAIINVWRSIAGPVSNHPLVLCDATTVGPDDLVSVERRADERVGELQVALHDTSQRWYYYPDMQMNEALLIKTYDSETDGRTRFTIHSSCELPGAVSDEPARESIETRCLVFY